MRARILLPLYGPAAVGLASILLSILPPAAPSALAQQQPFIVHDTRPVVMYGPYLSSLTETSATVVWVTDTPCHARVVFGTGEPLASEADNAQHGLLPIGTLHVVHLMNLEPGRTYRYRAVSTRVVKMKGYWPEKGLAAETPEASFTTFDRHRPTAAFVAVTDTHEDAARVTWALKAAEPGRLDFLVHLGDAFHTLESEDQLFTRWFAPAAKAAAGSLPLFFVRGNHEMRGAFARSLFDYVPTPEGRYYYARDIGPLHVVVIDTGEDKPDETNVYSRLNKVGPYRQAELEWLKRHAREEPRMRTAPFRVVLLHSPNWGWTEAGGAEWTDWANRAGIDLAIGGHFHKTSVTRPGEQQNAFPVLVLGQDVLARVEATATELKATVTNKDGAIVETLVIPRRR